MATSYLPAEILEQVITDLSGMKICRFDTARKQDLEALRLVSHRVKDIATPFLFENLQTNTLGLLTMGSFCCKHPELAKHIRGIRLVIEFVPTVASLGWALHKGVNIKKSIELQDAKDAEIFSEIFLGTLKECVDEVSECREVTSEMVSRDFETLAKTLPNLKHFETTPSRGWAQKNAIGMEAFYNQTGRMVHDMELDYGFMEYGFSNAGLKGIKVAAGSKTVDTYKCDWLSIRAPLFVNSPPTIEFFANLRTLDLGIRAEMSSDSDTRHYRQRWILLLNRLSNLGALRLVLTHDMEFVHTSSHNDWEELFLDSLFLTPGYGLPKQPIMAIKGCVMPKLESVTFVNWAVRVSGFHYFLHAHRDTLKRVELERLSLRVPHRGDPRGWPFIARAFQRYLPDVHHLRLSKLYTHEIINIDPTTPRADTAMVKVRKLQAEDYENLSHIAAGRLLGRKTTSVSEVEEAVEPVVPEAEWWWPAGANR